MNLFDMLQQAQNGNAFAEMARRFGLSEDQVTSAVEAMMPAFSTGLKRNTAAPEDMVDFLRALSGGSHAGYFEDVRQTFSDDGLADGNAILGHIFGSKAVSRAVAAQAEAATGIGQDILKQMLPALAGMVMGSLSKQSQDATGTPLGALMEQFVGNFGGARPGGGEGPLDRYEREHAGGNPFAEMMEQLMSTGAGATSDNPHSRMFRQFSDLAGGGSSGQGLFDDLFESGRQMGEEYQKNMESIFNQYLSGTDRRR